VTRELSPYNEVAYPGFAYPYTHPDRLATMAILHGLSPAPVEHCRMLEVACGDGSNLIPMAYAIPGSEFVGFDLAGQPIEQGLARIRELGLANVRIFEGNLLDVSEDLGRFDYIVAHGFYSWVPEPMRDRLLSVCRELLTLHGVAFVSYNALPGGYVRKMAREMMLLKSEGIEDPGEKLSAGIGLLRSVFEARAQDDPFRRVLEDHIQTMESRSPEAVFHDEFSEFNEPVLFSGFVEHARRHGLQYLSEAVLPPPPDPCYRADLQPAIEDAAGSDIVAQEQLLDFMRMRKYRETLLCHGEREVRRDFSAGVFRKLLFSSQTVSTPSEDGTSRVFTLPGGIRMETAHAGTIAFMEELASAWPRPSSWDEMGAGVAQGFPVDQSGTALLMRLAISKMIELHAWSAPAAAEISAQPRASRSALNEARNRSYVTALLHTTVRLDDPVVRSFLLLLDGSRDRAALLDALRAEYPDLPPNQLEQGIEPNLRMFHRAGLLEG